MQEQAAAAGAERGADGQLASADEGAREEQVREVGAADQQQAADGAEQHVERGADRRGDGAVDQRFDQDVEIAVGVGIFARQVGHHRAHVGLRLFERDAWLQASDREKAVVATRERSPSGLMVSGTHSANSRLGYWKSGPMMPTMV